MVQLSVLGLALGLVQSSVCTKGGTWVQMKGDSLAVVSATLWDLPWALLKGEETVLPWE